MKVRILSGSQVGAVVEMGQSEAESAIATGFAATVKDAPPPFKPKANPKPKANEDDS